MTGPTNSDGFSNAQRLRSIVAIAAGMGAYGLTLGLTYPLLSLILEGQGYSSTLIGLNSTGTFFGVLASAPLIPMAVRRMGVSQALLGSVVLTILLLLALRMFPNIWAWFGLRFLLGMVINVLFVVSDAWVLQVADPKRRGRMVGIYASAIAAGLAAGPALISVAGIEGWTPFVAASLILALAVAPPMIWARGVAPDLGSSRPAGLFAVIAAAPTLMAAAFVVAFFEPAASALLPVYGVRLGFGLGIAALMVAALATGELAFQVPIGMLSDRFDRTRIMLVCAIFGAAGGLALPLLVAIPVLFWAVLFLWGGFVLGIYTVALSQVGDRFSGADLVAANAAISILYGAGGAAGPALSGMAMDKFGPNGLPWTLAAICAGFALLMIARHPEALGLRPRPGT